MGCDEAKTLMTYFRLVLWGFAQGLIAAIVEKYVWQIADVATLLVTVLAGGIISAIVFSRLFQSNSRVHIVGFVVVSLLIPFVTMTTGNSLYYGRFYIVPDPIAFMVACLWGLMLLPFALLAMLVFRKWEIH
jgi:hypothetical protein